MKNKILLIFAVLIAVTSSCKKDPVDENNYPADGLVSYFNFDDNLEDQVGTTPDGTNNGSAPFATGKAGKAISLNGSNQYIEFSRKTFRSGNNISVSLWVKRSGSTGLYFAICNDFGMFTHPDGYAGMAISVPQTENAHGDIIQNEWTHLVGTYDGANIKTYINGVLKGTKSWPGTISGWDENLKLGMFSSECWCGSVDELFIYNKVLSQSEVGQLYNYHK